LFWWVPPASWSLWVWACHLLFWVPGWVCLGWATVLLNFAPLFILLGAAFVTTVPAFDADTIYRWYDTISTTEYTVPPRYLCFHLPHLRTPGNYTTCRYTVPAFSLPLSRFAIFCHYCHFCGASISFCVLGGSFCLVGTPPATVHLPAACSLDPRSVLPAPAAVSAFCWVFVLPPLPGVLLCLVSGVGSVLGWVVLCSFLPAVLEVPFCSAFGLPYLRWAAPAFCMHFDAVITCISAL